MITSVGLILLGLFLLSLVIELEDPLYGITFKIDWPDYFMPRTVDQQDLTFVLGACSLILGCAWNFIS